MDIGVMKLVVAVLERLVRIHVPSPLPKTRLAAA